MNLLTVTASAPAYDPERCNNGGSYFQPSGVVVLYHHGHLTIEVNDDSCGDFGRRVWYDLLYRGRLYRLDDNQMDERPIWEDEDLPSTAAALGLSEEELLDVLEAALRLVRSEAMDYIYEANCGGND